MRSLQQIESDTRQIAEAVARRKLEVLENAGLVKKVEGGREMTPSEEVRQVLSHADAALDKVHSALNTLTFARNRLERLAHEMEMQELREEKARLEEQAK